MTLIIRSQTLRWLRLAAEGLKTEEITQREKVSKKEVEQQLKSLYHQLNANDPLEALQMLAKKDFKVVD